MPYDYNPYPGDRRPDWPHRYPIEMLGRTAIIHVVLLFNYMHLRRTQKISENSRALLVLRLILFTFMPTLILAELFVGLCRTFSLLLHSDPAKMKPQDILTDSKRYLCGMLGMSVVSQPGFEQVHELEVGDEAANTTESVAVQCPAPSLPLCSIRDSADLQEHRQPWNASTIARILLLLLPILQGVGTIVLWVRRDQHYRIASLDKRNFVAAIGSITCSLTAMVLLLCRSEWSLNMLNSASISGNSSLVGIFFFEICLASFINEAPFTDMYSVQPFSWVYEVGWFLQPAGIIILTCLGLLIWFLVHTFHDRIKQKVAINWHFVLALPMTAITIWILVDMIAYVVYNIIQLCWDHDDLIFEKDPISNFLPVC